MGVIRLLPDAVASQVAAGEVVERPASVVKELVENSLDAGATQVDIEIRRAGTSYISVTDDGRGMERDDALLSLERHATSKIRTGADLSTVSTFGFRGEALPSIASVSRFRLCTRVRGAEAGTEISVSGGKVEFVRDCGEADGTRIEVRNLFFNLPARKKFLRGERTEAAHIEHQFQTIALAHHGVRFSLVRDGSGVRRIAAAGGLAERAKDLFGAAFFSGLFEFDEVEHNGIRVAGLLARPGHGRGDRSHQTVFVNRRPVLSGTISGPLRDAYGTGLPKGMHPAAILFLEMNPEDVDCNVHPAKREVRFRDGIAVREAVHECVRRAIEGANRARVVSVPAPSGSVRVRGESEKLPAPELPARRWEAPRADAELVQPEGASQPQPLEPEALAGSTGFKQPPVSPVFSIPAAAPGPARERDLDFESDRRSDERFRFVGALSDRYAVLEDAAGLVLLDNRAARERILFEQLLARMAARSAPSQRLLIPAIIELSPKDFAWIHENVELLAMAGLLAEPFGSGTVKVDGVPPALADQAPAHVLLRLLDDCREGGRPGSRRLMEESVARSVCCGANVAPVPRDAGALQALTNALMACELPYACPNGKPTMIQFSFAELDRKFGRSR